MASIKSDNLFLLPKRLGSSKAKEEFGKKRIKQWVDEFSIGDAEKSSFDLYGKLDRLNQLDISPVSRFEILELLQPSIGFVLDSLKQGCSEGAVPLNIRRRMIADLRQDILIQVVRSYKTVLSQLHDSTVTGALFHKQIRMESLRNAVFYLGETLLHSYITYQPCLNYTWKELHGIYYYSVINELHDHEGIETKEGHHDRLGIDDLYKQILLLALATPNSMLRGEAERVNSILKGWVSVVDLVPIRRTVPAESYFLVDARSDEMPCAPNLCEKGDISVGWCLVTDNLEKMLEEKVIAAEASQNSMRPTDAGALRLMNKLRDAWSQQIRPRELRSHTSDMVEVICGLDTLYQVQGGEMLSEAVTWRLQSTTEMSNPGHHAMGSAILDSEEVLIEVEPGTLEHFKVNTGAYHRPRKEKIRVNVKECVATNKSESGYCLNWPDSGDGGTHVGELVGVNPATINGDGSELSLGVVRWMFAERSGFLGMGVELLNGLFEPVILQRERQDKKRTETIKGFLQRDEEGGSVSLIAPPFYVAEEDRYRVITSSDDVPVDITNIMESTDSFVRLKFEQASDMSLVS